MTEEKMVLDFGKYKGLTLGQIVRKDRSYVEWLARKAYEEKVRQAAAQVLSRTQKRLKYGQLWEPCEVRGCHNEPVCVNCFRCSSHCYC